VELLNGIKEFSIDETIDDEGVVKIKTLPEYMQDIALLTDADRGDDDDKDKVSLMTIHASKGLEFKYVYIVGMEENLFPSQMALNSRPELEEERRLFYVALTRAMKKLNLSFATSRFRFGTMIHSEPSRFLQEIDPQYLVLEGIINKQSNTNNNRDFAYKNKPSSNKGDKIIPSHTPTKSSISLPSNFKPIQKATASAPIDPNFQGDDTSKLAVDQQVEHQRFGKGVVKSIEGAGENKKANIDFGNNGIKMLVLKFAKLKVLG
jgi:DNA helicase-2/ATP-dependent DNA helicase PcrA